MAQRDADGAASVLLELIHRAELVTERRDVELHRTPWARWWAAAATGEDALRLSRGG